MTPKSLGAGRYRVRGVLGHSQHATVFDAYDIDRDEAVAIKSLSLTAPHPEIAKAMYQREVGALDGFEHPSVVRMKRYFAEDEEKRLIIVLDRIPGGQSLDRIIRDGSPPPVARRMRWRIEQLLGVLDGLAHAQRRNVIHRDVKLGNILLDHETNKLLLVDFGIARILEHYASGEAGTTLRSFYSRPFAAPEQVLGKETNFSADLYAFGVVAACLLTWQEPPADLAYENLDSFLAPLDDQMESEGAKPLRKILFGLLREEPRSRPHIAEVELALRESLDALTEREPIPIRVTHKARDQARELALDSFEVALDDLNAAPRVEYQPDAEGDNWAILLLGRSLQAHFRPDRDDPSVVVLVNLFRQHPGTHQRKREHSIPAPFIFEPGYGSAQRLIDLAWEDHQRRAAAKKERARREDALFIARFILDKQRERMTSLEVRYSVDAPEDTAARTDDLPEWKRALSSLAPSTPEQPVRHSGRYKASGQYLQLHVRGVRTSTAAGESDEEAGEFEEAISSNWAEALSSDSVFLWKGKQFASAHGYDAATRTLTLKLKRRVSIDFDGVIACHDVAMEAALERQEKAITAYLDDAAVNPRLAELLLHPDRNLLDERPVMELIQQLEPADFMADLISRALAARDFFLVQGPPGTGKTTFISELMAQILRQQPGARILLTSQANEAVNNAVDGLRELAQDLGERWRIVRDASQRAMAENPNIGFDVAFKSWVEQTTERSTKATESGGGELSDQAQAVLTKWRDQAPFLKDVKLDYAESVQVHGMTCLRVPVLWRLLRDVRFDWVIIDEAARATPAELLVALVTGKRFILVGDHNQLPPFLDTETEADLRDADIDPEAARRSIFERLFEAMPTDNREALQRQFRMHRSIGELVGSIFYPDIRLETGVADSKRTLALEGLNGDQRVFWFDVNEGRERQTRGDTSWWNHEEVLAIERFLEGVERECRTKNVRYTVGIIAAYARQADKLRERVRPGSTKRWRALKVRIDTVDAFQGKQDDIILYSMVRANTSKLHFVSDRRRLNVAFSRARRLLVVFGHKETALQSPQIRKVLKAIPQENIRPSGVNR